MGMIGPVRRRFAVLGVLSLFALSAQLTLAGPAAAAPFTGGFSPTVFDGAADLNGDNEPTGRDDANAFYGNTHIIDGSLDCDAWGPGTENGGTAAENNAGTAGDGVIDGLDDCTLIGYDGTATGVAIDVENGAFLVSDGPLPTVFNAADPDNPDVGDSDFAWSTIDGRVDSDGNETINANDCHFGLIGQTVDAGLGDPTDGADILGNTAANTNPCGFGNPPAAANNGLVDLNSDGNITVAADSCTDGCFFGHNVDVGVVQAEGPAAPAGTFTGGFSPTLFSGLADLNGDGVVTGRDDANAFYGDTHIIDGGLDCNAWTTDNDGTGGDGAITAADDCTLIGYDGTADGVTIDVVDGEFQAPDGPLPTVFNAADPDNPDVSDSDFAWSAIGGRVDSDGNEFINFNDCHFGLIGQTVDAGLGDPTDGADILGNNQAETNPCGFGNAPDPANNGLVDLNSDGNITAAADSCNNCFFGHDVDTGFVMALAAETVDLTPPTDTNPEDTAHTVTANVKDSTGANLAGVTVRFSVTGANTASGSGTTNASGNATFTYTGANPGTDTITAFADTDGDGVQDAGEPSDTATKTWEARVATTVDLTPATDTNQEDTAHTVTANVKDQAGANMAGIVVRFTVTGANPTSGSGTTNASGDATFTYTGANPGTDTITAYADIDNDGVKDPAEPQDTATKTWTAIPAPPPPPPPPPPAETCKGQRATIVGTNGADTITGTAGADVIVALGGNDKINSLGGADLICAGGGKDTVRAGSGSGTDRTFGQGGNDLLLGQGGRDIVAGGSGKDRVKGGSGKDTVRGQGAKDKVRGQGGADKLNGGPAVDLCNGGAGIDTAAACEVQQLIP